MSCQVTVTGGVLEQQEINAYIDRAREKYGREPFGIDIHVDGDYVYLVGTLDRFNNAKRAEERDRVKHGL